ncbi:MAG: IS30 family transposase [Candidatus Aegiribacteria sp.]|nr:IS30 family transposase [Candidatus Aegiribacteria sp.]MBD3294728.1 IS30 family transposase [Candidatus Fermentibacteria bacterium]
MYGLFRFHWKSLNLPWCRPTEYPTAPAVKDAVTSSLNPHSDKALTLTVDNEEEFAGNESIAEVLDADIYFAHPYASREREINENTNGLLLQYFSRNRELTDVCHEEVKVVQDLLNHRPRKTLGYRTPHDVFYEMTER